MKQNAKLLLLALFLVVVPFLAHAQVVVGSSDEYDFDYLTPKTYEIGGISFEGAENFDTRVVQLVAGLQVGDQVRIPGDKISSAIENLWKQGMFDDVQIRVNRIQGNLAFLTIALKERPRMLKFAFTGVKKGEDKKLREEIQIKTGDVVTENMLRTSSNKIKSYFIDKGFTRTEVTPTTETDTSGRLIVTFNVKRGKKVKIDSLIFEGNKDLSDITLQGKMQKTRDVHFRKSLRFWKKVFWKKSRYMENDFREDLDNVIAYYNEQGYRDARIVMDTVWEVPESELKDKGQARLKVKAQIYEGNKFYFRNITFSGNTVYSDEVLRRSLRISKGDPYNKSLLEENLKYNPSGTDVSSLYMDNGYLFFRAVPVEVAVENDSIDIEVRIIEGQQARIRNVSIEGNTITNDKVIMRELHTRPGDLFSREALIRSHRELLNLKFFEEQLNNFSVRNIFNKDAWVPLPAGDGQKLSLNATTNGSSYYSISAGFTEPWLGGHRAQSLTGQVYHNYLSNGLWVRKNDENFYSLQITGAGVSFSKRLKWPDDYFIVSHGLTYKHYILDNYSSLASGLFADGSANDISYAFTISRNSFDSPFYTRSGSEVSVSAYLTPPFSLLTGKDYSTATPEEKYKWVEYYKINEKGFKKIFKKYIGLAPFGRYFLGGDGLSSWVLDGREVIPLRGYENNSLTPNGGGSVFDRFTIELRQPIIESGSATIWVLGFLEGGNCWSDISEFQPFKMYNSAGLGVRLYLPMLGLIGVDWGYGFDGNTGGSQFHFSIGQSLD